MTDRTSLKLVKKEVFKRRDFKRQPPKGFILMEVLNLTLKMNWLNKPALKLAAEASRTPCLTSVYDFVKIK